MLLKRIMLSTAAAGVALALAFPAAAQQQKACPAFPYVAWWGDMTHESVTTAVTTQYNGDWRPITDMLSRELAKMIQLRNKGEPYKVPNSTRQLGGDQLTVYIDKTRLAVDILNCLANQSRRTGSQTSRTLDERAGRS